MWSIYSTQTQTHKMNLMFYMKTKHLTIIFTSLCLAICVRYLYKYMKCIIILTSQESGASNPDLPIFFNSARLLLSLRPVCYPRFVMSVDSKMKETIHGTVFHHIVYKWWVVIPSGKHWLVMAPEKQKFYLKAKMINIDHYIILDILKILCNTSL